MFLFKLLMSCRACNEIFEDFTITEKAPTWAFSWLKVPNSAFTFKTLHTIKTLC